MRVIMSGGGTGGHVNPAIAIANKIAERDPGAEISFVGASHGIENKLVPAAGYRLDHIEIQGLRRSLSPANIKTAWLVLTSVPKAKKLLKREKPDLVMGTGGYACWPIVKAAAELGIPTALHESNAVPGVAVKMLEKQVDRIYVNFTETLEKLSCPEKAIRVGNPLKGGFTALTHEDARRQLGLDGKYSSMILSCGGSMGAEPINDAVIELMQKFSSKHPEILHCHATGSLEFRAAREKFESLGLDRFGNLQFIEYIYDMPLKMAAADVVINRAGAMTLSELAMQKKPCVLIPSPYVTNNHQYKNADALRSAGACVLIEEKELKGENSAAKLIDEVERLLEDKSAASAMADAISGFAIPNCGDLIYDDLINNVLKR